MNIDQIWNRACEGGGTNPLAGDTALAALLLCHGVVMNGGVIHAVECLSCDELIAAEAGYRFFGFESIATLVSRAKGVVKIGRDLEDFEEALNEEYWAFLDDDSKLVEKFETYQRNHPTEFSPLD